MKNLMLCPSIMSANFGHLDKEIKEMEQAGVDVFHLDIMDGSFVPNFALGLQDVQTIKKATNLPIDVHLMIEKPSNYISLFANAGADIIYFHPESDRHPARVIDLIKEHGKKVGIAINPGSAICFFKELLPIVDYVLVMTVNPGFPGHQYLPSAEDKIDELLLLKEKYNFEIVVDGAIDKEKVWHLNKKGVHGFVLGTKSMYGQGKSYKEVIDEIRKT